jgi:hypothetical protein
MIKSITHTTDRWKQITIKMRKKNTKLNGKKCKNNNKIGNLQN